MATPANAEESRTDDPIQLNSMNNSTLSTTDKAECTWQPKFKGSASKYVGYVESVTSCVVA